MGALACWAWGEGLEGCPELCAVQIPGSEAPSQRRAHRQLLLPYSWALCQALTNPAADGPVPRLPSTTVPGPVCSLNIWEAVK